MKRLVCLIFALSLLVTAAGCKPAQKDDTASKTPTSNVKSYAEKGRLDSVMELKIGDTPNRVASFYHTTLEALDSPPGSVSSGAESSIASSTVSEDVSSGTDNVSEEPTDAPALQKNGQGIVCLQAEDMQYYYDENDPESGILMMVAFRDSYMLTLDAATPEIVRAMVGKPKHEGEGNEDIWFFLATGGEDSHYMEYEYGNYRVGFYFMDRLLIAVSLCDAEKWDAVRAEYAAEGSSSETSSVSDGGSSK